MFRSAIVRDPLPLDVHFLKTSVPLHSPLPAVKFSALLRNSEKLAGEGSKLWMATFGANFHDANKPSRVCLKAHVPKAQPANSFTNELPVVRKRTHD